jgi:hypothetical protein
VSRDEAVAQLRLIPLDAPARSPRGRPRVVPTYTAEQRAAFRRSEEVIAQIRPESVGSNRKLCAGCGRIIHRERRNCGRRWCPLVNGTWSRDREAVIRRALETHGGPFLVIAVTQDHRGGWWDCDKKGHPSLPCSGPRGCKVKPQVAERENEAFPARRRALINDARTWAVRAMRKAGYEVDPSACLLVQTLEPQQRGLDHAHLVLGHCTKLEKAFARFFVNALDRKSAAHGLGFVDGYKRALWKQRQYQGEGQAGRVARYLSKYLSKDPAGDWLRAKAGQRVFYVAPWLSRVAGASMRLARLARIVWAASRGLVPMPRIDDEEREAVAAFIRGPTAARAP